MSRAGYTDGDCYDGEDFLRMCGWNANVRRCIAGRKGQAFMWELYQALEALPTRELITGALVDQDGGCCSLGAVALSRGCEIPASLTATDEGDPDDDSDFYETVAPLLGIKELLAREVMYQNDECDDIHPTGEVERDRFGWPDQKYRRGDTPAERWQRMREWVVSQLRGIP